MDSEPLQQLELAEHRPIEFELLPMSTGVMKARRHCNIYPCTNISTFYLVCNFGSVAKMIAGVCNEHANKLDDYLRPLTLIGRN